MRVTDENHPGEVTGEIRFHLQRSSSRFLLPAMKLRIVVVERVAKKKKRKKELQLPRHLRNFSLLFAAVRLVSFPRAKHVCVYVTSTHARECRDTHFTAASPSHLGLELESVRDNSRLHVHPGAHAHTRIRRLGVPYLATDAFAREARGIATCAHERKASLVPGKRRARTRAVVSIADVIAGRISYAQSAVRPDILTLATGAAEKTWEGGGVGGEINAFFFSDDEGGGGGDRESAALAGPVGRR